jgi:hypothetical protein
MPAIGNSWAAGSWGDDAWAADTWEDVAAAFITVLPCDVDALDDDPLAALALTAPLVSVCVTRPVATRLTTSPVASLLTEC